MQFFICQIHQLLFKPELSLICYILVVLFNDKIKSANATYKLCSTLYTLNIKITTLATTQLFVVLCQATTFHENLVKV